LPEIICNTSPWQYLHQVELLHLLPALAGLEKKRPRPSEFGWRSGRSTRPVVKNVITSTGPTMGCFWVSEEI
jgi:hypothetical protein